MLNVIFHFLCAMDLWVWVRYIHREFLRVRNAMLASPMKHIPINPFVRTQANSTSHVFVGESLNNEKAVLAHCACLAPRAVSIYFDFWRNETRKFAVFYSRSQQTSRNANINFSNVQRFSNRIWTERFCGIPKWDFKFMDKVEIFLSPLCQRKLTTGLMTLLLAYTAKKIHPSTTSFLLPQQRARKTKLSLSTLH